jgi:hypothetical protein
VAGGGLTLERCTFVAVGGTMNTGVVKASGPKLAVDRCLFVGFNLPLDIDAYPGMDVVVRQSIIDYPAGNDRSPGWAMRVRYAGARESGAKAKPRLLTLDHLTVKAGGLIEALDFGVATPLTVRLEHAAIQVRSLIACTPRKSETPAEWRKELIWTGSGNLFDVTTSVWVVLSAASELALANSPSRSFRFETDGSAASDPFSVEPAMFALAGEGVAGYGADVKTVGPPHSEPAPK